ncbi:MAG: OmpA family protein [Pseudomonadota bacterium]
MPFSRLPLIASLLLTAATPLIAAPHNDLIRLAQESDAVPQAEPAEKQEEPVQRKKPEPRAGRKENPQANDETVPAMPSMKRMQPAAQQGDDTTARDNDREAKPKRDHSENSPRRMRKEQSEDKSDASSQNDGNDEARPGRQRPQNSENEAKPLIDTVPKKEDSDARKREFKKPERSEQEIKPAPKQETSPDLTVPEHGKSPVPEVIQPRDQSKQDEVKPDPVKPSLQVPLPKDAAQKDNNETTFRPGFKPAGPESDNIQDVQKRRRERKDDSGNRTLIEEPDNRVIVREGDRTIIRHDENERFTNGARNANSTRRDNGQVETIIRRDDGSQLFNVVDENGRIIQRYRRDARGREISIIDNREFYKGAAAGALIGLGLGAAANIDLPTPRLRIPRDEYIVEYDDASDEELYDTLIAPPVEELSRSYSLDEVRYNSSLRERTRRIDLDAVNFASGSWKVSEEQYGSLKRVARAILRAIERNPAEVFLIEGHTDAVGSDIDNLSLSDRRAESVAEILSDVFDVPPENLVTQGYGEQYLKIDTEEPNGANRRVAVRRITPLMKRP